MDLTNLFVGSLVVSIFGALTYFSRRLIEDNDKKHKETTRDIKSLLRIVAEIQRDTKTLSREFTNIQAQRRFGTGDQAGSYGEELETIKRKVSKVIHGIEKVQKEVDKIIPKVAEKNGEIIWIKDEISEQNAKIKVMFEVLSRIVKSRKR